MNENFKKYIDTFSETLLNSLRRSSSDCKRIYVIKHYNTFDLREEDIEHRKNGSMEVYYHNFIGSEMTDAFEPFLGIIKDMYNKYYVNDMRFNGIDGFLSVCGIYPLHRSIFKSYFEINVCRRYEDMIASECEYEHKMFIEDMKKLFKFITEDHTIFVYINNINKAAKSTIEFLKDIYENNTLNNFLILAAYNDLHTVRPHMVDLWDAYTNLLKFDNCIIESIFTDQLKIDSSGHFHFTSNRIPEYLRKLTNLFYCLDFDQFDYYRKIIHQKLEMERLSVDKNLRYRLLRLFATYCIYAKDLSMAKLLCDSLGEVYEEENSYDSGYTYNYLTAMTYMYNGRHIKAHMHAEKCIRLAKEEDDEYNLFKAELLDVMVNMSGWNNIFFCTNDVPVETAFLEKTSKYNYTNHLAHTYIFAFDNDRDLYTDVDKLNQTLPHFMKGVDLAISIKNLQLLMDAYRKNIMISSSSGCFDVSNYFYSKLFELVGNSDPFKEGDIYKGWGYNCCATEQYQTAHDHYNKALQIYYKLNIPEQICEVLYNMSINCILSEDYDNAFSYLQMSLKIVKSLHLNDLRVCNISKLFGLLTLCSYRLGNHYNCQLYLDSTAQFLSHILSKDVEFVTTSTDPSFTLCDDDLFLYHYVNALLCKDNKDYDKAFEYFDIANFYVKRSEGNQFFSVVQYKLSLAELYRTVGNEEKAMDTLREALTFCEEKNYYINSQKILAAISGRTYHPIKYKLILDEVTLEDISILTKQAALSKNYAASNKQLEFLNSWQKITDITNKTKESLIDSCLNTMATNFNLDSITYIKYINNKAHIEYDTSTVKLDDNQLKVITDYFNIHHSGFVTSKMRKNYHEYDVVIDNFNNHNICSIVCIPFYVNEKLDSLFISCIYMKNNWSSVTHKYLLDESELNIFSLAYRQLVNALEMLEKQQQIRNINTKLENAAITDYLTGLYNRDGFHSMVEKSIEEAKANNQSVDLAVLYIDLDNFKYYNDTFGHDIGDFILKSIANLLKESANDNGFAVRFGGDEFLIILKNVNADYSQHVAKTILSSIVEKRGYAEDIGRIIHKTAIIPDSKNVSASIGIAIAKDVKNHDDVAIALKQADSTLYQIKHTTKCDFRLASTKE